MKNKLTITQQNHNNVSNQACAACRYQRRKCAPDCLLAPYFPHDSQRQFQNAHKLFGVSNITKIIRSLETRFQKDEAMRTIMYQADARARDPVGGCFKIVKDLFKQIEMARVELECVLQQLAFCRTGGVHGDHGQNGNDEMSFGVRDEYDDMRDEFVWEDKNVVEPIQSWPPLHMLHASVCDDFKSLLINDNQPREENLLDEGNEKGLIKLENVCYNQDEYEMKNSSFGIVTTDCKDIQVVEK